MKKNTLNKYLFSFTCIFAMIGVCSTAIVSVKNTNEINSIGYESPNLGKSMGNTNITDFNNLPFKNLLEFKRDGSANNLPTGKLYCADINKYGDIALGFDNLFIILSYDSTGNGQSSDKHYNIHEIVNDIDTETGKSLSPESRTGTSTQIGSNFVPTSASFDNNGDLLFSYMTSINALANQKTSNSTGMVYIPYTPQFDGLKNPDSYSESKKSIDGIDIINPSTTQTTDPAHINDSTNFRNFDEDNTQYSDDLWKGQYPILNLERITSAQLSYDGNYIIYSSSRTGSKSNIIPDSPLKW